MQIGSSKYLDYQPLSESDWSFFLALYQDQRVIEYITERASEEDIRYQFFIPKLHHWDINSPYWLCLMIREKQSHLPVGVTGFIHRGNKVAEVGFIISPKFQRQGYGSESLRHIVNFAFSTIGFRKLTATVTQGNQASQKTLERIGFQQEGSIRKNFYLNGQWYDDLLFGLFKEEIRKE